MKNTYRIIWSNEALTNLKDIIEYLEGRWTQREIKKFAQLLEQQFKLIQDNPFLFSDSKKSNGMRKAVLSKQTTIYYRIIAFEVHIITLFDNRKNPIRLKNK